MEAYPESNQKQKMLVANSKFSNVLRTIARITKCCQGLRNVASDCNRVCEMQQCRQGLRNAARARSIDNARVDHERIDHERVDHEWIDRERLRKIGHERIDNQDF